MFVLRHNYSMLLFFTSCIGSQEYRLFCDLSSFSKSCEVCLSFLPAKVPVGVVVRFLDSSNPAKEQLWIPVGVRCVWKNLPCWTCPHKLHAVHFVALFVVVGNAGFGAYSTLTTYFSGISAVATTWSWICNGFLENPFIFAVFHWASRYHLRVVLALCPVDCILRCWELGDSGVPGGVWNFMLVVGWVGAAAVVVQQPHLQRWRRCVLCLGWHWVWGNLVLNCWGHFAGWKELMNP